MSVHVFIFFKIPDVCSTSFYYLFSNFVLKLKNTFWDIVIEMSTECYLIIGLCFGKLFWLLNFLEFLIMGCQHVQYTNCKQWGQFLTALKKSRQLYFQWGFWKERLSPEEGQQILHCLEMRKPWAGQWDSDTISDYPLSGKVHLTHTCQQSPILGLAQHLMAATTPPVSGQWVGIEHSNNYYEVWLWVGAPLCLEPQWNCWVKWATASSFYTDHSLFWTAPCSFMKKPKQLYLPFSRFSAASFYSCIWGHQKVFFSALMLSNWTFLQLWLLVFRYLFPWVLGNERLGGTESPPLEYECLWEV